MTDEVKKVYCGDCGFLTDDCQNCSHPGNIYKFSTWEKENSGYTHKPKDMNIRNDCKKHKPKIAPSHVE